MNSKRNAFRKQVIEAKEGPLELRRKKDKGSYLGEEVRKKWRKVWVCSRETASVLGPG